MSIGTAACGIRYELVSFGPLGRPGSWERSVAHRDKGREEYMAGERARALRAACTLGSIVGLLVGLALFAASASAAEKPAFIKAFGPDGTSSSTFANVGSVAFDQQSEVL